MDTDNNRNVDENSGQDSASNIRLVPDPDREGQREPQEDRNDEAISERRLGVDRTEGREDNGNGVVNMDDADIDIIAGADEILPIDDGEDGMDADAVEFRLRFYEAVSRRVINQPPGVPPLAAAYEEFDEDDNVDLLQEIIDDDLSDGISTGPTTPQTTDPDDSMMNEPSVPVVPFDTQLPSRHAYLGDGMEAIPGRTILDGGTITEIPLVLLEFHLVPGQTLPLTVFHSVTQSALLRCIPNNRHFGIIHAGLNDVSFRAPLPYKALGTTAEIYEYHEERPDVGGIEPNRMELPPSVNIKAKGRHRFNVLCTYRQSDGHLMAKVKIRPEISLPKLWSNWISSHHRYVFLQHTHDNSMKKGGQVKDQSASVSTSSSSPTAVITPSQSFDSSQESSSTSSRICSGRVNRRNQRRIYKYYSAITPWPYFVYEQFDEDLLSDKIKRRLSTDLSALVSASNIPTDPTELSFWLAQNLTINDSQRLQMLKMDTPVERLRFALKLLGRVSRVIECSQCEELIANHGDIFSMSVEGPQGTYVNPHGYVHELITVTKIQGIVYKGSPSTESSWFPGYSWRIMECRVCRVHVGWKFEAVEKLVPKKFWGLARRSVNFKYFIAEDEEGSETATLREPLLL